MSPLAFSFLRDKLYVIFTVTKMEPLNLKCLENMGLLHRENDGSFHVITAGPIAPRAKKIFKKGGQTSAPSLSSQPPLSDSSEMEKLKAELQVYKAFAECYPSLFESFRKEYNSSEA